MHPNASRVLVVEASEAALERLRATLDAREIEIERLDDPSRLGDVAAALRPHVLVGGGGVASTIELAGIRERVVGGLRQLGRLLSGLRVGEGAR